MTKEEAIKILQYKVNMSETDVYIGDLDKTNIEAIKKVLEEIERLNELVKGLREERDYLFNKTTTESKFEIERLNNIINGIEKWLEEQHQFIIEIPAFTKEISIEHKTMEICYENILDKIQELKGENK